MVSPAVAKATGAIQAVMEVSISEKQTVSAGETLTAAVSVYNYSKYQVANVQKAHGCGDWFLVVFGILHFGNPVEEHCIRQRPTSRD